MELSAHELVKLGRLYLQKGRWHSVQLISPEAVERAVSAHVKTDSEGIWYGYFFRNAGAHFSMAGKWGQQCMVYPERRLVIAYLSHHPDRSKELYALVRAIID